MATYVNDLRLKEIATGDESGTWGTSTNTNLELIADAFSYATKDCFATDADATETMADGVADEIRSLYLKVTSSATLTATRTLTLAPNTVSKTWIIENATTGGQSISISQGSGANVTIPNGDTKIIYTDGAGAGAAVTDAFANLNVGDLTATNIAGTLSTAAQPNITSVGTLTGFTSTGIDDNATSTAITIDSSERVGIGTTDPSSGDGVLNLETSSSTILNCNGTDANGGFIKFQRSGTTKGYVGTPAGFLGGGDADDFGIRAQADFTIATGGANERLRIASGGNVGINETSPDSKLHVTGEIRSQDERGGSLAAVILNGGSASSFPKVEVDASNPLTFVTGASERARFAGTTGYFQAGVTSGGLKNSQIVAGAGIINQQISIPNNGSVDVTVPGGGIMITSGQGFSGDCAIFSFKSTGGSQGTSGQEIGGGTASWSFGSTSDPGGGKRNRVWIQAANTLRFADSGFGTRSMEITFLSNTN